jgi:hypothetical protein
MSTSPDLGGARVLPESTCGDVRDDTAAFVRQLRAYAEGAKVHGKFGNRPPENPVERVVEDMFDWSAPVFVARAPGRLDVMGGIADYSGSLVLQMPIAEACHVAVQFRNLEEGPIETKKKHGPRPNRRSRRDRNHRGGLLERERLKRERDTRTRVPIGHLRGPDAPRADARADS